MKILLVSPILTSEYDSGKYILKALCELGHYAHVWDYRLQPNKRNFPECDLVLVNKGESIDPDIFKPLGVPVVNWYPDQLSRFDVRDKLKKYDKVYSINKPEPGYEWVEWLPGAYDEDVHRDVGIERKVDCMYIGTCNSSRKVDYIKTINPNLIFGNEWDNFGIKAFPPVYGTKFTWVANHAKILVNIHQAEWGTNRKLFELIPCGFTLTDLVPGVEDIFGELADIIAFRTPEGGREMVKYYLEDEDERNKVWEMEKKIVKEYSYKNQIQKILKEVM